MIQRAPRPGLGSCLLRHSQPARAPGSVICHPGWAACQMSLLSSPFPTSHQALHCCFSLLSVALAYVPTKSSFCSGSYPLTGASPPGRAGSLSAPGPARPSSTPPPDCCSPPLQTPLLAPRGLRAKLKPDLPAARLSRRTCRSLREPPAVFRRPVLPRLPFR